MTVSKDKLIDILTQGYYIFFRNSSGLARCLLPYKHTPETAEALVTRFMAGEKPGKEGIFSWLPLFLSTESGPLHPQSSSLLSGWTSRLGAVGGLYAIPAVSHDPSNEKFSGIGLGSPVLDLLASIQAAYGTLSGSTLETIFEGFVSQTDLQPALVARLFVSIGLASNGDVCSMARGWGGQKSLPGKEILAALEDPSYSIAIRAEGYLAERRLRKLTQPRWVMSPLGLRFCSGLREERAKEILVLLGLIGDSNLITKDRIQSLLSVTVSSIDELSILYALISETPVEDRAKAFGDYKISPDTFIGLRQPIGQDLDYARDISKSDTLVHLTASIHATLTEGVIGARHILEHSDFESKKRFEDVSEALYYLASRSGPEIAQDLMTTFEDYLLSNLQPMSRSGLEIAQDLMGSNNPKVIAVGRKIMDKLQIFDWDKFASDLTSPRWLGLTSGELNFCVGLRREDVLRALEFLKTQIEGGKIPSLIARKCCDILGSSEVISYLHEEGMVESGWQFFGNVSVRMTGRDTPIPRDQADKVSFMLPVPIEEDRAVAVGDTPTIKNFSASVAALIRRCRASSTIPDLRPLMRRGNMFSQRDAETCILDTIVSLHRKNKLTRDVLERIASSLQDMPRVHGFLDNYLRSSAKQSLSTKTKEVLTSTKWLLKFKAHGPGYQEIVWGGRLSPFQADQIFIRLNLSREKIPSSEIRAFIDAEIDNLPRSVLHSILFSLSYLGKLEDTTFLHVPSKKMVDAGISTIFQRYGGFLPLPERGDITLAQEIESKYGHKWAGMDVDFTASFLSLVTRGGIILRGEAYSPPYFGLEIASWFVRAAMQIEHGVESCLLALYEICKRTPKFSETLTFWSDQIATQKDEFNTTLGLVFKEIASGSFNPDTDVTQAQKDLWLSLQSDSEIASRGNQKGDTLGTSENRKEPVSIFEGEEKVDEKIAISPTWVNLSQLEAVLSVPVTALMREGFATANLAPETALSEARALLPLFAGKHGPVSNADLALWFSPPNDAKLIALLCMAREGYLHPDWISYLIREYPSSYDLACIQAILPTPKVLDLPALRSLFQENGLSFSHESFGVNLTVYLRMMQAGGKEPNLVSALRPGNTDEWQVKTFTVVMCEMIEQGGLDPALLNKPLFELESLASTETVQNAVRKIKSTIEKSAKTAQSDRPHPHVEAAEAFAEAGRVATKTRKAFLSTYGLFSVRDPNYDHCSTEVSITFADKTLAAAAVPGDLGTHDFFQAMAAYIRLCGEEGKTPNFRYLLANSSLSLRDKVKGFSRILSKSVDEKKIHADAVLRVREDIHNANLFQQEMLWLEEDLLTSSKTKAGAFGQRRSKLEQSLLGGVSYISKEGSKVTRLRALHTHTAVSILRNLSEAGHSTASSIRKALWQEVLNGAGADDIFRALLALVKTGSFTLDDLRDPWTGSLVRGLSPKLEQLLWCESDGDSTEAYVVAEGILDTYVGDRRVRVFDRLVDTLKFTSTFHSPSYFRDLLVEFEREGLFPGLVEKILDAIAREKYLSTEALRSYDFFTDFSHERREHLKKYVAELATREDKIRYSPRRLASLRHWLKGSHFWIKRDGAAEYALVPSELSDKQIDAILKSLPLLDEKFLPPSNHDGFKNFVLQLHELNLPVGQVQNLFVNLFAAGVCFPSDIPTAVSFTVDQALSSIGGWFTPYQNLKDLAVVLTDPYLSSNGFVATLASHLKMVGSAPSSLAHVIRVAFNTPDSVSGMTAGEKAKCIKTLVNRGVDANWYTNQTLLEAVSIAETQSPEINGWVEADSFMRGKKDDMVPMAESLSDPHKEKHEAKNYGGEKANKDLTEALTKSDWLLTDSGVFHLDGMSEGKAKEIAEALIDSTSMTSAGEDAIQALTEVSGGNQTVAKKIISSLLDWADSPSERVTQNAFQSTTIEKLPKPGPKEWDLCGVLGRYNPEIQGHVAAYILKCGREGRAPDFRRLLTSGTGTAISHGWVLVLTERALELGYLDRVKLREASEQLKNSQSIHLFSFGSDLENYLNELEGKETLKESLNVAEELTSPGMAALQMMSMGPSKVLLRLAEEVTSERKTEQWRAQVIDHLISRDDFQSYLELYVARALTYMVGKKNNETLKQEMAQAAAESITFSFGCTQADLGSPAPISHIPDSALLYEEMYRRVHHAYERKVQNRAVLPPGESYARVIASEEKRISEAFGVDDALKQVAAMKEALNLTQKRVWDKKAAMEPQVATKVAVPMLDPVKIAAGTASVVGSMAITDSTDEVKGTKETQRMKSDSNVAAAKVGTKASQKPLKGKAMEEEEEDLFEDDVEEDKGPDLGQILVKTLKDDGKTIALRTGVKHTREQLTALVTNFINSKSIRRFEGESDEAYTARAEAQRSGVSAFLLSDVGQQLITYLLGLSWPVLESNIEDGKVRKYGGMVAREIRAQSGSDLLDGFLEEVVFPLLAVITSEAKNFGKMVLAPAKRVRVSGLNESPADEKARLMERLAELERDANVVPMAKSR